MADGSEFGERQTVKYLGGNLAEVSKAYLTMQGHELEDLVKEKIPIFKCYHNPGELLMMMIDQVIRDLRDLTPVDIVQAFCTILEYEPYNSM